MSAISPRPRRRLLAAALAAAAVPGLIAVVPVGTANADVCFGAGRRITVSGCTDFGAVAPYAPPPAYYAPLPEDMPPPPPPPPVQGCVGWNGRWVSANTCR
ncbi:MULTISPECIES: hypothetical protein [Mycolicibacterium]|uniref:Uncharacterized protein n=1 Tax=Mycolicibacterium phocaicum TaxID=319706 RepID=A0A7I7ZRV9_9MYCO|nr:MULTISPECIES: hypothetical protein [Mycolicibacterium]RUP29461.1 MAG: hypothetical protein EKK51_20040 [Mycolicibacterium sp.]TLH73707.1 hypothetical protein C1S79_03715 [Mycolicibacterium phocaicum]UCZ61291.1 hypothetical protein LHJ73_03400 [Mycolicibacterium phocaicum]BBZ55884.1 hypothetical protein MPHO_28760 [Mycolicibacterium phocaicum]